MYLKKNQQQQITLVTKPIRFKNNGNVNKGNIDPNPTLLVALKDNVKSNHQNGRRSFEWYVQSSTPCGRGDGLKNGSTLIGGQKLAR